VRAVARYDPARIEVVLDWPLRDLFLAYLDKARELARAEHYVDLLIWASLAPYQKQREKPPKMPKILKG
jgi:hypothetical protein